MPFLRAVVVGAAASVSLTFLLLSTAYARAAEPAPQPFDIRPQSLAAALSEFARQSHEELLFAPEVVAQKGTHGVHGTMEPLAALKILLKDSGLSYSTTPAGAILVGSAGSTNVARVAAATTSVAGQSDDSSARSALQLAQVDQGQTSSPSTVEKPHEEASEWKKTEQLQEVIVTGSRIPTIAGNQVQPVLSYTRDDIENSGQTTIGDFLNTLPDVSNFTNSALELNLPGMQTVQLHGLPVGTTVTLLDGRRLETNFQGFFDLSNIPLAAIERIEILPVGASAIYGADGLGGAVNTILRKNFDGLELNASLDHAPDVNNPGASLAWGKTWQRGSISLIGTYQETGQLLGAQRQPTESSGNLLANLPASVASALGTDTCQPGNVYSVDGTNLPGLSSPYAAIPPGITGKPTIGEFTGTAGKRNFCSFLSYGDIVPQTQREGALLSGHYDVADSVDLFTEVLFSHGNLRYLNGAQVTAFQSFDGTVAANNPYNPFGEAVNVSFAYPGIGYYQVQSTSFIRPMVGIEGSLPSDWHYEVTAYLSRDQLHQEELIPDSQLLSDALASSNPATALNPFTSGPPGTPQLLSSLVNPAVDNFLYQLDDRIVGAQSILRGPILQMPSGALQAVIGSEYSQERQDTTEVYPSGNENSDLHLGRNTYAVFGEARIPILGQAEPAQGRERLALTVAGRYDHSDDYGGKATWQSGLLWRPSETLAFRGGYGLSYQPPQLYQIAGPQFYSVSPLELPDPFRGNQLVTYPVAQVFGSNPNLKPETGDAFTLGLEYASQLLTGLHASLTWYDLMIHNFIGTQSPESLLTYPGLFPGAVTRAPPTPQDQQLGYLGLITQLKDDDYNFGDIRVAGVDANIRYAIDTRVGQFTPSVAIANIYKWQTAILPGAPEVDAVSKATSSIFGGGVGWSPRWKGTAALAWKQGPLSTTLMGRYTGRYLDYQVFVPNTNETGNTWIYDFTARYELGKSLAKNTWLAGAYVSFGVVNLFNKVPPFANTSFLYDFMEYDDRGRYLHLSVGLRL
jgi:iron complex outermembrane receptor protein